MNLYDKLMALYPSLKPEDLYPWSGSVLLQNDGDGDYIAAWDHPSLPRPTEEQLAALEASPNEGTA